MDLEERSVRQNYLTTETLSSADRRDQKWSSRPQDAPYRLYNGTMCSNIERVVHLEFLFAIIETYFRFLSDSFYFMIILYLN